MLLGRTISHKTLVWTDYPEGHSAMQLLRQRACRHDRAVRGGLSQDQGAVQVDRISGVNHGEAPESLLVNPRDSRLGRHPG